ncbi:hypothetical protein [Streptomyces spectabilis]|uniref:D-alanyl-D-alanine carboxypeptidase n=1 Tax=Streptomyces spectabilis TaxID=68270 RepID=A0A5P2X0E2_STRST|nr:hypothetical protein [Streptomyces spectabilis]MBB5101030.1 hypothetical protein [Streptomyces spectabilis]MCI3900241.1 hypothetical protein [Streptomyces spectabilis]QEV57848.1 hypothetical protein CP982_03215 [Streptomyces spectabilis]GGV09051.1 hypothetical protein GCM10010245_17040 [Streptomyces spectabilis]
MSLTLAALTAQDKDTLRTAAYGAVSLMAAADAAGSPHKAATRGAIALASATGQVGHVLAAKTRIENLGGTTTAALAEHVLPALTAAMDLLNRQSPAEAADFRSTVTIAVEAAARAHQGEPGPALAAMARKITAALDAA